MEPDIINDLKQFISATMSQQLANFAVEFRKVLIVEVRQIVAQEVDRLDVKLTGKIDDLSAAIAEVIDARNSEVDEEFTALKRRVRRLEVRSS